MRIKRLLVGGLVGGAYGLFVSLVFSTVIMFAARRYALDPDLAFTFIVYLASIIVAGLAVCFAVLAVTRARAECQRQLRGAEGSRR